MNGIKAADAVEQCRLARPVGADDSHDLPWWNIEAHAVECNDAAEMHAQISAIEQGARRAGLVDDDLLAPIKSRTRSSVHRAGRTINDRTAKKRETLAVGSDARRAFGVDKEKTSSRQTNLGRGQRTVSAARR